MILGIDPKVDYAFKHLFGRESTRPILIDLIDSVLDAGPDHRIREVELLNPFNPKESLDDKLSILDIKARDQAGRQFNIEMQMLAFPHFEKRILYYWAKLHQQQLHEGDDYVGLKATISISFLDHVLFPKSPSHHLRFHLLEAAQHFPFADDVEIHVLELPKFTTSAADLTGGLDTWLYFLRHIEKMEVDALPPTFHKPAVLRAVEELTMLKQTDLERERYETRRKAQLDDNTRMRAARMEGLEEGLQKGRQEALIEATAKVQIIKTIQDRERMLQQPATPLDALFALSLADLNRRADELHARAGKQ